jgi:hypothetical protein
MTLGLRPACGPSKNSNPDRSSGEGRGYKTSVRIERLRRRRRAGAIGYRSSGVGSALAAMASFAVFSAFAAVAVGQTINLSPASGPAHLDPGQMIIVGGVRYVGRDSGRCKLWISAGGEFRSAGCDVIPDERPWKERLADVWEDKPAAVVASATGVLVVVGSALVLAARRRRRRSHRMAGAPGAIAERSAP